MPAPTSEPLKDHPKESKTVTYAISPFCFLAPNTTPGQEIYWLIQSPWLIAADSESNSSSSLLVLVVGLLVGAGVAFLVNFLMGKDAKSQSKRLLDQTKLDCENLVKSAEIEKKEALLQLQSKFDKENQKQRDETRKRESELDKRETALKQASDDLKKQERFVESNQRKLSEKIEDAQRKTELYNKLIQQQQTDLQRVTGMSKEEAQKQLLTVLERDLQSEMGSVILKHEKRVQESLQQKTQDILLTSMQRYASSQTAESTTSTVDIPNDEMKGRIIGREGRNIRAFEKISGCDLIIDDTPGVVIVSGFDPVRREIARASMEKLVTDGRIHPSRIEEIVAATEAQIEAFIKRKGEEAAQEVNIQGLHERTINMLGRLHFRTSYSQNVLRHSIEVAFLSGMMAEMIGLDPMLARRAGLLHDIGKAADHELEGGHPKIGADLLKRNGENDIVVHAALGHHDQLTTEYPYTLLVATSDACSASRPGARRESLERYIKRMEELETIAKGFHGVEQAFAIQAGRELRVIVGAKNTDDAVAAKICRDIAKAFEDQLTYPGEIKVTVVRESRFTETAR
ncbi:MAG: ribonuclease Y [Pirellula sp.]|jgi:ribonuclease Y|nr:ribonuclease Y [Pirellula sp.]